MERVSFSTLATSKLWLLGKLWPEALFCLLSRWISCQEAFCSHFRSLVDQHINISTTSLKFRLLILDLFVYKHYTVDLVQVAPDPLVVVSHVGVDTWKVRVGAAQTEGSDANHRPPVVDQAQQGAAGVTIAGVFAIGTGTHVALDTDIGSHTGILALTLSHWDAVHLSLVGSAIIKGV